MKTAILLIGHGSRHPESGQTVQRIAGQLAARTGGVPVEVCFLGLQSPGVQEGIDACVRAGAQRVLLCPCLLAAGRHLRDDLPQELARARQRHPGLEMVLAEPLGDHPLLAEVVAQRFQAAAVAAGWQDGVGRPDEAGIIRDPLAIERQSFAMIDAEVGEHRFDAHQWPIVRRIIHTTADFDFATTTCFSPGVVGRALAALRAGACIYCDTNMVLAGVNKNRLAALGGRIACHVADPQVAAAAREAGVTRSIVALRQGVAEGAEIFLIGNAPTALFELLALAGRGEVRPALVVGVPVGFVGAAESKEALYASNLPYILCRGRKGGSAIAAAILNQLLILAAEG
ncbi:precorrin-8X methylmutase [Geothermobacter ehrlichii]|uniref:Precorrin-8X methylmutase n=1 Tax=Geothermobacter ehrlichii TaxID=213224 RepID=A0A5D3WHV2_9BACT|nr:precorrin-8X methylmutase [Geothermobacter ehrlichii]TYO98455.1 precorrin-8X methylmutase [Geothermobacter ehrlichii]